MHRPQPGSSRAFRNIQNIKHTLSSPLMTPVSFSAGALGKLKQNLSEIKMRSREAMEREVSWQMRMLYEREGIDLGAVCSLIELKYIVVGMLAMGDESEEGIGFHKSRVESKTQQIQRQMEMQIQEQLSVQKQKGKKTNIYIDFDFTELVQKTQQQVKQKDKMISKLQDILVSKQNELQILQQQAQQLKLQQQKAEQQNQAFQKQNAAIQKQNKKMKDKIDDLTRQVVALKQDEEEEVDEFLRRCLLTQALSIQHMLGAVET